MKELIDRYMKKYNSYWKRKSYLEQELKKLNCPYWIDDIIKPIAEILVKEMPDRHYEILGPFGLCSDVAIHFYKIGEENSLNDCKSINFRPIDLDNGKIEIIDYNEDNKRYEEGTLRAVNGMNYSAILMTDTIEELIKYVL